MSSTSTTGHPTSSVRLRGRGRGRGRVSDSVWVLIRASPNPNPNPNPNQGPCHSSTATLSREVSLTLTLPLAGNPNPNLPCGFNPHLTLDTNPNPITNPSPALTRGRLARGSDAREAPPRGEADGRAVPERLRNPLGGTPPVSGLISILLVGVRLR